MAFASSVGERDEIIIARTLFSLSLSKHAYVGCANFQTNQQHLARHVAQLPSCLPTGLLLLKVAFKARGAKIDAAMSISLRWC